MTALLDTAHAAMRASPDDEAARLRWYGALLDADLILVLEGEPMVGRIRPRVFALEDGPVVLAFDSEEKLAGTLGVSEYAAMPGRAAILALAGQGAGLGVNLGAAGAFLMDTAAVDWLAEVLAQAPDAAVTVGDRLDPAQAPPLLLQAIEARLTLVRGHADCAYLAVQGDRLVLVFLGARAPEPLARMVAEAAAFSGAGIPLDAGFLPAGTPLPGEGFRVWDLTPEKEALQEPPSAPDATRPPRLR